MPGTLVPDQVYRGREFPLVDVAPRDGELEAMSVGAAGGYNQSMNRDLDSPGRA